MKHNDIKLTLARHDQSTNSSAPYGDFLQLIGSCFKQGKSEIGGKIKCSQTWTLESQLALQHARRIRLTWHSKQQKKRQGKYSQVWSERLPILMGSTAITEVIFSDESYTPRPGFSPSRCFPLLLICLPLVCSFRPSGITLETLLLLVENISGLKPDHQKGAILKCLLSQTQRNHGSCLYSPLCTWTFLNS